MKLNALEWYANLIAENRTNLTSLGLGRKVRENYNKETEKGKPEGLFFIEFEDPEIERICHVHGVNTEEDAAAVTDISGWFAMNDKIRKFNELKYFTGLRNLQGFSSCNNLQEITIPSGVERLIVYCFEGTALEKVFIPEGVKRIDDYAFNACKKLKEVWLPSTLTSISGHTFPNCVKLKKVHVRSSSPALSSVKKVFGKPKFVSKGLEIIVESASSLGLASKVKKSFAEKTEEDIVKNASQITQETLTDLYDSWGHIPTDYQGLVFPTLRTYKDFRLCSGKIGKSYSKFIDDMTDGTVACRFSASSWGEENLDAIEFWKDGDRKVLKYRLYGEEKYSIEFVNDFYKNKKNYILDWFIPATLKFLEKYPEYIGRFYAKLIK